MGSGGGLFYTGTSTFTSEDGDNGTLAKATAGGVTTFTYSTPDGHRLRLDVYEPLQKARAGERRPAVLQIHGGGWVIGSKDQQGIPLLNHLASCGWVGFNIDYRLSPKVKYPDHLVDCKRALAWIREHADEYSVDPDFVVVTGGSAGGHLCALVALTQNDERFQPGFEDADTSVQAAVPFYGVYDMLDRNGDHNEVFGQFVERMVMGVSPDQDEELWRNYSPVDHVRADAPPMFVIHGDRDVLVPVGGARTFVEELRAVSDSPVVYAEMVGGQHAFEVFPSARAVRTVEAVERFLHHEHTKYLDARAAAGDVDGDGRPDVVGSWFDYSDWTVNLGVLAVRPSVITVSAATSGGRPSIVTAASPLITAVTAAMEPLRVHRARRLSAKFLCGEKGVCWFTAASSS